MKDWEVKRFCFFGGAEYESSLGLSGLVHSTDTFSQMKKWIEKNKDNDEYKYVFEEWQVDDLKKGITVLTDYEDLPF